MASHASDERSTSPGRTGAMLAALAVLALGVGAYFLVMHSGPMGRQGAPLEAPRATQTDYANAAAGDSQAQNSAPSALIFESESSGSELVGGSAAPGASIAKDGARNQSRPQLTEENRKILIEHGYVELADGGSAYASYDTTTLRQMANGGDRAAQVEASQWTAFTIEERATYAEMAASQGYTAGLFKFGKAMELMPSNANARLLSYAYQLAAAELGDPAALAYQSLREDAAKGLSQEEVAQGDEITVAIVKRIAGLK